VSLISAASALASLIAAPEPAAKLLYDFEDPADIAAWSNLALPDGKEPPVKWERVAEHATSGQHSLKITFAGGEWPTLTTTQVTEDWLNYSTFQADVTASRRCVVGFTVMQEKSTRAKGWDGGISRWTKTAFLEPGKNTVTASLRQPNDYAIHPKWGKIVRFEIFMYRPHDGESIFVDNIRLTTAKESPVQFKTQLRVLGADLVVADVQELGKKLKDRWTKPEPKTIEQVEAEFKAKYDELKKTHPHAVLAILRDGEKNYDPKNPEKAYAGWKDAYWSSHGPDGLTHERAENLGKRASHEVFMRHRSPLMQVDLSSIPKGAEILAGQLVILRANAPSKEHNPEEKPTMWVAEPCNRPWEEYEVNAYEYARDKFWREIGGRYYGDDPDFLPFFLAYGPGCGKVNVWDFTEAVRFWTSGGHANHGFMLHGDSHDYMIAHSREAAEVKNRPAVMVVYDPSGSR
jgi:hypothetical protein